MLNYENYDPQGWQGTLIVIAVAIFCLLFNVFLAKRLPFVETVLLVIYIVGFFLIVIILWALAPRASAHDVFTNFNNGGGWNNAGTAVMIGLSGTIASLAGFDCAAHMGRSLSFEYHASDSSTD